MHVLCLCQLAGHCTRAERLRGAALFTTNACDAFQHAKGLRSCGLPCCACRPAAASAVSKDGGSDVIDGRYDLGACWVAHGALCGVCAHLAHACMSGTWHSQCQHGRRVACDSFGGRALHNTNCYDGVCITSDTTIVHAHTQQMHVGSLALMHSVWHVTPLEAMHCVTMDALTMYASEFTLESTPP